ncbi:T9SS type A sorting domain-containing protein [candidate division KSB1 bacterium]|nr:T9SS type A sorting domain-containing protein [candidate division KSB1 bacterium]
MKNVLLYVTIILVILTFPAQQMIASRVIIPDFQVNENIGGTDQNSATLAIDDQGAVVVTWSDWRNGDQDIYTQRYSSDGAPLGGNVQVNDDDGCSTQSGSLIAMDGTGHCIIVWKDERHGACALYAQRYDHNGTIGANFRVTDADCDVRVNSSFALSANASGELVIVWEDQRNGDNDIYAQRYSDDGMAVGGNVQVNDRSDGNQRSANAAISKSGRVIIMWLDNRDGDDDVIAQCYDSNGAASGSNFRVNDDDGGAAQSSPVLVANKDGDLVITWLDKRRGGVYDDIYAQSYTGDGIAIGANVRVNDDEASIWPQYPAAAMDPHGNFVIAWSDSRYSASGIYAQRFAGNGAAVGDNFKVDDQIQGAYAAEAGADDNGNFVITWLDGRDNIDIYVQRYASDGERLGGNVRVNDDDGETNQNDPVLFVQGSGHFMIVWADDPGDADIFAQRFTNNGVAMMGNIRVNDDEGSSNQSNSVIAADGDGNFVIAWQDDRHAGNCDIYAQRCAKDGLPLGANVPVGDPDISGDQIDPAISIARDGAVVIAWSQTGDSHGRDIYTRRFGADGVAVGDVFRVNDDGGAKNQLYPAVAALEDGAFVIAWRDSRNGDADIYAQRFSADGIALGSNFRVNDDVGSSKQHLVDIAAGENDGFTIAWEDVRDGERNIYAQRFGGDGSALGSNFRVNDDQGTALQTDPRISAERNGVFLIAWVDERHGQVDIYAQRYVADGSSVGGNFRVNDEERDVEHVHPAVSMDEDGKFIIAWENRRMGASDIFAQRFAADGSAVGDHFLITNAVHPSCFSAPDVQLRGGIYTTWTKNRTSGTGTDVWANVLDWWSPVNVNEEQAAVRAEFNLLQNYPNPFNESTTISYSLPRAGHVTLKIYDIRGREILIVRDEYQQAGSHSAHLTSELSSGIYFYTLRIGGCRTASKKMIVLQ